MPRTSSRPFGCPICQKGFLTQDAVMRHLNQPNCRCYRPFLKWPIGNTTPPPPSLWLWPRDQDYFTAEQAEEEDISATEDEDMPMEELDVEDTYVDGPSEDMPKSWREEYPDAGLILEEGPSFMQTFHQDKYADQRADNLYYPFATSEEWQLASFLSRSSLSIAETDELLRLELIKKIGLSFTTTKDLRSRYEILPKVPQWTAKPWVPEFSVKKPLTLYYRDPLECLQSLLQNPLVQDHIGYSPFRLYESAKRGYTEWLSGDDAWEKQKQIPPGATLLGVIAGTDKTQITSMTGSRVVHPLLISTANIDMGYRMKASNHMFMLCALLPVAIFLMKNRECRGVLNNRLYHACVDDVFAPLKKAAEIGVMMADAFGRKRMCFTPLLETAADPWDLPEYVKRTKEMGLNGVHRPYWRDWPISEPSTFLTPKILHHWLKMFWDHEVKWCLQVASPAELNFRFSVLRPHIGISRAKQVTVPVIAGAKGINVKFLTAIRALVDFKYIGQAPKLDEEALSAMDDALRTFHDHKSAIVDAEARMGKNGPINDWRIPKLEFLQSVVLADVTEHAHIPLIKFPASQSNNQNHEAQICRNLDRCDKAGVELSFSNSDPAKSDADDSDEERPILVTSTSELLQKIEPTTRLNESSRVLVNYFVHSEKLSRDKDALRPFRTLVSSQDNTAFQVGRDHVGCQLTIEAASDTFHLPGLKPALRMYLHRVLNSKELTLGGRRENATLPPIKLKIWHSVRIQSRAFHDPARILSPETVSASPPDSDWKFGRGDAVIVNSDTEYTWPYSGLQGRYKRTVLCILLILPARSHSWPTSHDTRFDVVGSAPDLASGMYRLKRAKRADGTLVADLILLDQLRARAELTPRFGKTADRRLTKENSLDKWDNFWLTKYLTKELFFALHR
ncbi:hypothetical protein C8R44DRAFT_832941 [Mycena epipterygia]|nr:hypothetical protein C8R44DRAFT_832941 [Mycena epipterygia]